MDKFPHTYTANANSEMDSAVAVSTDTLQLDITPPSQFGGEDTHWSPEDLFSAGLSSCYILTLKSISKHKKLNWNCVDVLVNCYLDKKKEGLAFYNAELFVKLKVNKGADLEAYEKMLHDSEKGCLFSKSLITEIALNVEIVEV